MAASPAERRFESGAMGQGERHAERLPESGRRAGEDEGRLGAVFRACRARNRLQQTGHAEVIADPPDDPERAPVRVAGSFGLAAIERKVAEGFERAAHTPLVGPIAEATERVLVQGLCRVEISRRSRDVTFVNECPCGATRIADALKQRPAFLVPAARGGEVTFAGREARQIAERAYVR